MFLGKTTTPEFGWKGVTDSPLTGAHRQSVEHTHDARAAAAAARRWQPPAAWVSCTSPPTAAVRFAFPPASAACSASSRPSASCRSIRIRPRWHAVAPGADLAHGARCRADADRDRAARCARLVRRHRRWTSTIATDSTTASSGLRIAYSRTLGYAKVDPEVAALVEQSAWLVRAARRPGRGDRSRPGGPDRDHAARCGPSRWRWPCSR